MPENSGGFCGAATALVGEGRAADVTYLGLFKALDAALHNLPPLNCGVKTSTRGFDGWSTGWTRNWLDRRTQLWSAPLWVHWGQGRGSAPVLGVVMDCPVLTCCSGVLSLLHSLNCFYLNPQALSTSSSYSLPFPACGGEWASSSVGPSWCLDSTHPKFTHIILGSRIMHTEKLSVWTFFPQFFPWRMGLCYFWPGEIPLLHMTHATITGSQLL